MTLLERDAHLQHLVSLLQASAADGGRTVAIAGEAGSGKTSLIRAFSSRARASARVLVGACDAMSAPRPLGPILDVASGLGSDVARLLRDPDHRPELFTAILDGLVSSGPTLLVIEDAHWADDATLDLIRFLGRRIDQTRTLLAITYRDEEIAGRHPLRLALGDLATAPTLHRVTVAALSEAAVRELAADAGIDVHELYSRTGGNPFYVTEVLSAGGTAVPPTVRDAVLTRAARLPTGARAALDAAAVIGARGEPWLLNAIVPDATEAVEACLDAGLLVAWQDAIQFRHQLAEDAVLAAMSPLRRIDLHAQVLAAMRQRMATVADYARLSHHAAAAGDIDAVLRYAPEAGRRAAGVGSHREAAAQYARALRHADHLAQDAHADLLAAWFPEGLALGDLHRCIDAADQLIGWARERGDEVEEAKWHSLKASILVSDGRNAEADAAIGNAIRLLEPLTPTPVHAQAWRWKASLCMLNRDYEEAIEWGQKAVSLAARFNLPSVQAGALNAIGSSRLVGIDADQGRADLEQGLAFARAAGADTQIASILGNLGSGHGEIYRFDLAERYLTEGIAFAGEHDLDGYRLYQTSWLALTHMFQGQWSRATEIADEVLRAPAADVIARIMALIALGRVRARRGDPEAWPVLDEALSLAISTKTLQRLAPAREARAEAAWLAGRLDQVRTEARAVFEMAVAYRHPWHIGELAYWAWKSGDLEEAPAGAAEPYALQMRGDWQGAAARWSALGCPYEAARARAESCDEDALREAFGTFDRLGARPAAQSVAARLRDLGYHAVPRGVRAATRANPGQLTRREREVLDLIARGHTNTAIASQLYLSPKTVERHVTSILAKLDAGSRNEAVREARARGISSQPEG